MQPPNMRIFFVCLEWFTFDIEVKDFLTMYIVFKRPSKLSYIYKLHLPNLFLNTNLINQAITYFYKSSLP